MQEWQEKNKAEQRSFDDNSEMVKLISDAEEHKLGIEKGHVELQLLEVRVEELDVGTDLLAKQKENLDADKKSKMLAIEEMSRQQLAKEETNQKRIQAKLQKDKNPHMKELLQRVEDISESNEEFQKKLREEGEKYDALKDELISRKETLRLACEKNTETEDRLSKQTEELDGMRDDIKTK